MLERLLQDIQCSVAPITRHCVIEHTGFKESGFLCYEILTASTLRTERGAWVAIAQVALRAEAV